MVSEEFSDLRDLAIVSLFYATGMRRSELINLKFDFDSSGEIKAGELNNYLNDFKVINKSLKLATINKKLSLDLEIRVSRGKGYLTADKNKRTEICEQMVLRSK